MVRSNTNSLRRWAIREAEAAYDLLVTWLSDYRFSAAFHDLRDQNGARAGTLAAELERELGPGHQLATEDWRVIAEAIPQDEIVLELDGEGAALVHLTWKGTTEIAPHPLTTIVSSRAEFDALVQGRY